MRGGLRQRAGRTDLAKGGAVFALAGVVAALVTMVAWSLASPVGASPDDDYHLASIWCARGDKPRDCQSVEGNEQQKFIPLVASGRTICYFGDPAVSAGCQDGLKDRGPDTLTDRGNWTGSYPPLFYQTLSFLTFDDVRASVVLMRIANGGLAVVLLGALAWALPRRRRPLATVPLLVTSVPLAWFVLASTNPSAWAVLGAAVTWPALYGAFETRGRRQVGLCVLAVVGATISAGSRADGGLFAITAVGLVLLMRIRRIRTHLLPTATAVVAVAIAATYFLHAGHSDVLNGAITDQAALPWSRWQLILLNLGGLPVLWLGPFGFGPLGGTGWLDVAFPAVVIASGIAVWLLIVAAAVRQVFPAKLLGLALTALALVVYPLYLLVQTGVVVGQGVQPRYILPLLVMFTGVALLGRRGASLSLTRGPALAATAALTVAHSIALHVQMRRYVTGFDIVGVNLDRDREWWWTFAPGPTLVWLVASTSFAVLAWVILRDTSEVSARTPAGTPQHA